MKRRSVQVRLTLWYTLLMAGMAGLLLVFLLVISGAVSRQTAMDQLETTLRENLSQVSLGADGSLQLGEDFSFYQNGVYTLVYSQSQALLAGQVPVSFTAGDLRVDRGSGGMDACARSLGRQAEALMAPFVRDEAFAFWEVEG